MKKILVAVFVLSLFGCAVQTQPPTVATFNWQPVQDATWYLLEVYDGANTQAPQVHRSWYTAEQVANCDPECSVTISLEEGNYYAQVMDWGAYGYGTWTQVDYYFGEYVPPPPPPTVWTVPTDGTFAEAMETMTDCGTVYINADIAEPAIVYGTARAASYIVPDYGCNWNIIGVGSPVVTYDPQSPPYYYEAPGIVMLVNNSHKTSFTGLHFIGTRMLGDGINQETGTPIDKDISLLLNAPGDMDIIGNEFEQFGHVGAKSYYTTGNILYEDNICHDGGFTSRDHCVYFTGGAYVIERGNKAWNITGGGFGLDTGHWSDGGIVENNIVVNSGYGIWSGYGRGQIIRNNFAMNSAYYDLGIFGGGHVFTDNVSPIIYSERSCGAIVTNWCADPIPNDFYNNGNYYETISHPDRIE